jgi:plasmid maintenance system antidote protein VapI
VERGDILEKWIATAVGKMHINRITHTDLAQKMGVTREYVTMILNGRKKPSGAKSRIMTAIDEIITERG